jgi:hypothetical protein
MTAIVEATVNGHNYIVHFRHHQKRLALRHIAKWTLETPLDLEQAERLAEAVEAECMAQEWEARK